MCDFLNSRVSNLSACLFLLPVMPVICDLLLVCVLFCLTLESQISRFDGWSDLSSLCLFPGKSVKNLKTKNLFGGDSLHHSYIYIYKLGLLSFGSKPSDFGSTPNSVSVEWMALRSPRGPPGRSGVGSTPNRFDASPFHAYVINVSNLIRGWQWIHRLRGWMSP